MEADQAGREALVSRAKSGDGGAFAELFASAMDAAYRLAVAMLGDPFAAEDVVQDACATAWRRLGNLRPGCPPEPWFLGIVANGCRSWRRSRWWRVVTGLDAAVIQPVPTPGAFGPDLDLRRSVARLPAKLRAAVVMRFYLDLPVDVIATALEVPPGTVKSRIARGVAKLRLELTDTVAEVPT